MEIASGTGSVMSPANKKSKKTRFPPVFDKSSCGFNFERYSNTD
jgi:hypothetical protein